MNKVLFETAYMGDIRGIMLTVLGFGGLLLLYLKIKSDAKTEKREKEAAIFTVVAKGVFVMIAMGLVSLIKEYKDVVITYKNGNYVEIEGTVENYSTSLKDNIEYFTVDGVDFTCYEGEPFRYAKLKKNKIIISGRHLRIRYIPLKHENVIVYIEQMMPEEWETD